MDLWIRSQDRTELLNPNRIYLKEHNGKLYIYAQNNNPNYDDIILGNYQEKRALEVLDEIQNIIKPQVLLPTKTEIHQFNTYVYEMPKE